MKQYIVEETVIREMPETTQKPKYEYRYGESFAAYKNALSTMPTYPRGDNGKWKVGQIIREGVDFGFVDDEVPINGYYGNGTGIAATPIEPEPKKDVDESALREIVSVYRGWNSTALSWPDLLKQLEGKFIIQYKK